MNEDSLQFFSLKEKLSVFVTKAFLSAFVSVKMCFNECGETNTALMWDQNGRTYEQNQKSQKPNVNAFLLYTHTHTHSPLRFNLAP